MQRNKSYILLAVLCGWLILFGSTQATVIWDKFYTGPAPRGCAPYSIGVDLSGNISLGLSSFVGANPATNYTFGAASYERDGTFRWGWNSVGGDVFDAVIGADGVVYITGDSSTVAVNSSGSTAWSQPIPGSAYDPMGKGLFIDCDTLGNVFVLGSYYVNSSTVAAVVLCYSSGSELWREDLVGYAPAVGYNGHREGIKADNKGGIFVPLRNPSGGYELHKFGTGAWTNSVSLTPLDVEFVDVDNEGNALLVVINNSGGASYVQKYSSNDDTLLWQQFINNSWTKSIAPDQDGNVYVLANVSGQIRKISPSGDSLWTASLGQGASGYGDMCFDEKRNLYVAIYAAPNLLVAQINSSGTISWTELLPPIDGYFYRQHSYIDVDDSGYVYAAVATYRQDSFPWATRILKLQGEKAITIRDAHGDSIPNVQFELIKVSNNRPWFDEDTLGTFITDDKGQLELIPIAADSFRVDLDLYADTLVVGDSLKIAKHVHSVPAVKHQNVLGTMYSVHLDNTRFAADGHIYFDTLTSGDQNIVLNHTELRYNLLVSVEWEATEEYLWGLEDNLRYMSNYLYDVTDGQIRLDTIYIFDNNDFYTEADILVFASNMEWPRASAAGILRNGVDYLYMPRIWMGDSTSTRNHTDAVYPLSLVVPSKDYRTKAHEFGHYALNFFDEYLFWHPDSNIYSPNNRLRCLPTTVFRYGFMDYQYEGGGMSSEMSNSFRYELAGCRNTNQWGVHALSCWDHLERWVEAVRQGPDNLFVPILKPDVADTLERVVSNPGIYFAGPNNDLSNPDYDVGSMIRFPNPATPQFAGYSNKHVTVHHSTGGDNAKIQLWNNPNAGAPLERVIEQGHSSDAAGAWVLGIKDASYQILASKGNSHATVTPVSMLASLGEVPTGWLYGVAESGGSGMSKIGNRYAAGSAEDSITIELNEVQGYYPLIFEAELLENSLDYILTIGQPFSSEPTVQLLPSYGGSNIHSIAASGSGYEAGIADSLGTGGTFVLWAVDDSSSSFFVPSEYVVAGITHTEPLIWIFGSGGQSEFRLDSINASLDRALILSSSYPVIRTGLDGNAVQAGQAHCLSVYPHNPLTGSNQVVIRYDDADLKLGDLLLGNEATLAVYRWADALNGWELIGGSVDTADNAIYAPIAQIGVFAAFTLDIITDVEDDDYGGILPYRFELSQNYPNPFNPTTTIEYSVPERNHVTIDVFNVLGQRIQTLVDREESAGSYTITWDGTNSAGSPVATGVYLYRFQAGDHIETKKMLLLK